MGCRRRARRSGPGSTSPSAGYSCRREPDRQVRLPCNTRHNDGPRAEIPARGGRLPGRQPRPPREGHMSPLRPTFTLLAALALTPPAVTQEKAPPPREVSADRALDELVRAVDRHFAEFWARNKITPAPLADDAEFLRRLSLDLVGRIPTAAEARAFIDSKDPDKR